MDPVELAKQLELIAKGMLDQAVKGGPDLVPGLFETYSRTIRSFFDLETAAAVNGMKRKAAGLRGSDPAVRARAKRRAQELLKAGGGG